MSRLREVLKRCKEFKCIHPAHHKINQLATRLTESCRTEDQKARAIFEWMRKHINFGQLKLFEHPYPRTDLEILEDREGLCGELTILFLSLALAAGLEVKWASLGRDRYGVENSGHICPLYKGDDKNWHCVDLTPYYAPFGFKIDHKEFTVHSIKELETQFKTWTEWLIQDAMFIGLPLAQLINTGPIYEGVIDEKEGKTRMVFVSLIPEHGDKGGETCKASLIRLAARLYEVSEREYRAYDKTPLELKINYKISSSTITTEFFFFEWDEIGENQSLIFAADSLEKLPKEILRKYAEILRELGKLEPFILEVLREAKQINARQTGGKKLFNMKELIKKVIEVRIAIDSMQFPGHSFSLDAPIKN